MIIYSNERSTIAPVRNLILRRDTHTWVLSSTIRFASIHHPGMGSPLKEHVGIGRQGRVEIPGVLRPQVHTGWQNECLHRSMHIWKQHMCSHFWYLYSWLICKRENQERLGKLERTASPPVYIYRKCLFDIDRRSAYPIVTFRAAYLAVIIFASR